VAIGKAKEPMVETPLPIESHTPRVKEPALIEPPPGIPQEPTIEQPKELKPFKKASKFYLDVVNKAQEAENISDFFKKNNIP